MRIDFLELINFRNMKSAKVSFAGKDFAVLIGDNGSGKTTILEAITKAFVPVLRIVNSDAVKECDLKNSDIMCGASNTAVTVGATIEGVKYIWTNKRRLSSQTPFDVEIEQREQAKNDLRALKSKYPEFVEQSRLPLVLYYGTDRIIRDMPQRGHIKDFKVTDALRYCFDNANYFRDFYDWFKTEEDLELRRQRENSDYRNPRLNCVRTALERMIKGYTNLRIELAPARMVLTSASGIDLEVDQLSGGYKAVLSVVADIAKRMSLAYPKSCNPLEEEAVILIDELDLHLHPRWQKTIVEDLKRTFPHCQFIITTHSPFIIQSLHTEELFDINLMRYETEQGSYNGWSIDAIQEKKMGVEIKTPLYHALTDAFSEAMEMEDFGRAKDLYARLKKMVHPESYESKILDLDMEMLGADDKT